MAVVRSACAFLAGACTVLSLPALPSGSSVAAGIVTAALAAAVLRAWPVLVLALGFGAAWLEVSDRLAERLAPVLEGQTISIRGSVASVPQLRAEGVRFRFAPDVAAGLPSLIELTWYEPAWRPRPAERLVLEVRLRRPRGFSNPGGMDQEARLLRDRVGATGYVRNARSEGRRPWDVLRRPVLVARGEVYDAIREALGERPATGIVAGLSVGLQDALSREQWQALARSGTSHLMAISGMHIGMQAAAAAWVAKRIARWRQRRGARGAQRDAAVLAGTLTALVYALLAGWSVPTQRTVLMIALVGVALKLRRRIGVADGLALGALAVLALDPLAPLAIGFWLSFVAVAVILFVGTGHVRAPGVMAGFAQVQLAVTIGLMPVIASGFGSVSLVSAAVNAVAIPLYTLVIVPVVLLGTAAVLVVPGAGTAVLEAVAWLIEVTWPLIEVPSALPYAVTGMATLSFAGWLLLTAGALAALAPMSMPGRVAGLLIVIALAMWRPAPPEHGAFRLAVLDVGQGLATVVQTHRHVLVYDTGPLFRSGTDTGLLVVEPYLRSRGIRRIDLLVASHDDDDHVGGAASLSALLDVRARVASGRALDALGPVTRCRAGEGWEWDGVRFRWLHPGDALLPGDNDRSCVLEARAGAWTLLLAGDAERLAEQQMLARGLDGPIDIVVVPHHGSRTSSSAAFVAALAPRWAVVSAGYRNRWGFPAASVVSRWQASGAQVPGTADSGAIEFNVNPGRSLDPPSRWRIDHPRPWADP
jgi:competence protein ComEC